MDLISIEVQISNGSVSSGRANFNFTESFDNDFGGFSWSEFTGEVALELGGTAVEGASVGEPCLDGAAATEAATDGF